MEMVVERVVRTYGMMVTLSREEEDTVRKRVLEFVEGKTGDENTIAVEAIKLLRGPKPSRTRRPK
ncbi:MULTISPECIES: hypothetical protein [Bradyrhizobium]|uniref:Uncharacterized protein n=1 Tax=Bradyrhizobium septentrionale TaxID=1404411 RepID=A0ABZ2P4U3_9BRAD|nr:MULTISPECIES: hypothetical protein [Bradyrhizobium]MCK7664574.1 hypothetical protein [Bradyrhizobium sp. 2S1]UGY25478.1 hypothetical protein HU675_0000550 [Bradyrhizobium septentrionale]